MTGSNEPITELLNAWKDGDKGAEDKLMTLVRHELRRIAGSALAGDRRGESFQATELVNELYIRLMEKKQPAEWQNRAHFLGIAGHIIRQVLVDEARRRLSQKRGGDFLRVTFSNALDIHGSQPVDLLELDQALSAFEKVDAHQHQVVVMRFFGGMEVKEIADYFAVSQSTVKRDWRNARLWLLDYLRQKD